MFRYYLGGNTAAPSGLYARLCHAFLVTYNVIADVTATTKTFTVGPYDFINIMSWLQKKVAHTAVN